MESKALIFWVLSIIQFTTGFMIFSQITKDIAPNLSIPTIILSLFFLSIIGIEFLIYSKK